MLYNHAAFADFWGNRIRVRVNFFTFRMNMKSSKLELERVILESIQRGEGRVVFVKDVDATTLTYNVRKRLPEGETLTNTEVAELVWSLLVQGLVFIDFNNELPPNWNILITERGRLALQDQESNPDNANSYIKNIRVISHDNPHVMVYAEDALSAYRAQCYLASSVMLGVASEAAFLIMARSFAGWLPADSEKENFIKSLESERVNYITKFVEFRKRIEKYKSQIPEEFSDGMSLNLDSVLDLLRIYRNESGHPKGRRVHRDDVFINLQMFARYLKKLYSLKEYFDSNSKTSN